MADEEEVIGFNTEEDYVGTIEDTTTLIETVYGELDDNAGDDSEVEAVTGQTVSTIDIDLTPAVLPEFEASEFTDTSNTYTPETGTALVEYDDDEDDDPYTPELPNKISRETMTVVEPIIGEVDAETIASYNELSADVYAVFTDGTRKQVEWSDVFDPMGDVYSNVAIQGAVVSAAKNQHFWTDTSGVHVTDDDEDSWNTEYAKQNHGSLSTPTVSQPWHNILLNSYGFILRWGLLNLAQISKSSVAFYTGDGNSSSDILAMFGATQAQIGKSTEKHVVIDSNGVTAYNGDGTIAPMRAYLNGSYIDDSTITGSKIANSTITGSKIASSTIENSNIKDGTITGGKIIGSTLTGIPQAAIVNLSADYAHITNGTIDNATIDHADVNGLSATYATVNNLTAATGRITTLETNTADIATLRANSAKVANLTAQQLEAANAYISSLTAGNVTANDIIADTGKIHNLTAQQLSAAVGYIADLTAGNITTTDLIADHGTIGSLDSNYAQINMANVNNAWITSGTIKNGAISDAMINSVSANKLTAGTIDASNITVTNLNADNITAGTINGQRIGTGSLSLDKLSEDVYTETEVDNLLATMQSEIDGAIETWTGTAVPTLNNVPASGWSTNADKDKHVGDVYFVVNSQSQQNGYNYRFTKSGNTYSWALIKDTDITNALSRLSTAEGKITTFDSDITTLKTDTGTLKTKTQSLETSLGDKVDVTTFNDLEDTVDGHSQTISQHTTAISNKADNSTVTSVTNRVSKNEQDISGINTTISELSTTVASKADGSTVETVSNRLNTVSNTVDGHTSQLSSITSTQTSIQGSAVKSTVQLWFTKANTTAPNKPTAHVTTNNASTANAWNLAVPTYNASYPNYYYCYEYEYLNGTYGWSAVTRDIATGEAQSTARTANTNASNAVSTANTANTNASNAVSTANTANTNASNAVSTANTANTNASNAVSTANTAASDASTAKTNAATAVSTANTANTNASSAVTTANTAKSTADKNLRESQQLWFTKANATAPGKPTSKVTSTATTGNAWTTKVPTYNASYKYYFYCMQYIAADGTVTWSDVIYDQATTEAQSVARAASADLTEFHQEYATFKQTTQNFESTVGETYATKMEIAEAAKQYDSDTESPLVVGDNAATAPLRSYEGAGHAEQFTTTGKNLVPTYSSGTSGGITRTVNADGSVTLVSGTPSANYNLDIELIVPATGTYSLSGCPSGGGASTYQIWTRDVTSGATADAQITDTGSGGTGTLTQDHTIQVRIRVASGYAVSNLTFYPQLELGSTATDYEPYTGGAPSPSPDYPQEIQVVRGRNLLNLTRQVDGVNIARGSYTSDASVTNQVLTLVATGANPYYGNVISQGGAYTASSGTLVAVEPNTIYYLSWTNTTFNQIFYTEFDENKISLGYLSRAIPGTITTKSNTHYIVIRIGLIAATANTTYSTAFQLTLGSTPQPYVPYGHVGLEAQGRNLLDASTLLSDTSKYMVCAQGRVIVKGLDNAVAWTAKPLQYLSAGTYTIVNDGTGELEYRRSGASVVRIDAYTASTFTLSSDGWIQLKIGLHATYPAEVYPYLIEGTHSYEPYYHTTTPIPLPSRGWVGSLPDGTADVLTLDSAGKVEWELNDAEVVLDGSESWTANGITGYLVSANVGVIPDCKYAITGQTPVMSNLYPNRTPTWTDSSFGIENRTIWVGDRNNTRFGSLDGFKAFLASTNLTILYPLATPIIEECGYINMPQVSEGCTISIPELEDYGISWWCKASESMANVTTAIEKRVTTAETSITQTKEQILLKANSSDVYTKTQTDGLISTEVTNRNAAIETSANAINLSVSQNYTTKTDFNNLKIGGRNLLINTGLYSIWDALVGQSGGITRQDDCITFIPPATKYWWTFESHNAYIPVEDWDTSANYTLSIDVKIDNLKIATNYPTVGIEAVSEKINGYSKRVYEKMGMTIIPTTDDWCHFEYTVSGDYTTWNTTPLTSGSVAYIKVVIWLYFSSDNYDSVSFRKLKLEKGNKATDWTPAPEDVENYTDTQVNAAKAAIKVTTDSITTEVAKKTDKTAIISTINQTAETVKIQASKVNITGDAVFSAINNDTGTTKISGGKIDATSITLGQSQVTNYVSIRATTINYSANTATLEATLYIDGTAKTTGVTYVWMKDGTAISGATSRTYSVPASSGLNHSYSCKCTATV